MHKKKVRSRQDSNLRGETPLDFKSNALTTRPRLHWYRYHSLCNYKTVRRTFENMVLYVYSYSPTITVAVASSLWLAWWSRGMILASGARGPGFKSRSSPTYLFCGLVCQQKNSWRCRGSNPRPSKCESDALPLSYIPSLHDGNFLSISQIHNGSIS